MIHKNKRQVVIVSDIRSDKIEQAIFILRDDSSAPTAEAVDSDIVMEAHRIINGFLYPVPRSDRVSVRKKVMVWGLLWLGSAAAVIGLSVILLNLFH